jgi:hypothetical protein
MTRTHQRYSPSKADRFFTCPGSVKLIDRLGERVFTSDDEYSAEGQMAHDVLEAAIMNACATATQAMNLTRHKDYVFSNKFDEMQFKASINDAIEYIFGLAEDIATVYGERPEIYVEQYVNPTIVSAPDEAGGFSDIIIISRAARRIYIIDYKHGVGIVKAVVENRQLLQYGAGVLFGDMRDDLASIVDEVVLVIIQPRAFHPDGEIREWTIPVSRVAQYLAELDAQVLACERPDAPLVPNYEHCRLCPALPYCPAVEASGVKAMYGTDITSVREAPASELPDPKKIDSDRLAYIKQMRPFIDKWLDAVDEQIAHRLFSGLAVPGFKAVEAAPQREYHGDNEAELVQQMAAMIGCEYWDLYNVKLKPLTEVEKIAVEAFKSRVSRGRKKKAAEDARQLFAYFTTKKPTGKLVVAPLDDPRPAVNRANMHFAGVTVIPQKHEET